MPVSQCQKNEATVPSSDELNAAFRDLVLPSEPSGPSVSGIIAHLKLLGAFYFLKEEITSLNGVFGLWDPSPETDQDYDGYTSQDETTSHIREQRWNVYVTRAAFRFEIWWNKHLRHYDSYSSRLTTEKLLSPSFTEWPTSGNPLEWTENLLPPLDILMVWHAFMLNPRSYLSDCLRYGLRGVWSGGLPWHVLAPAIDDNDFHYTTSAEAVENFCNVTGLQWENLDDSDVKEICCPCCLATVTIPGSWFHDVRLPEQGKFQGSSPIKHKLTTCTSCFTVITHDLLRGQRLRRDILDFLEKDWILGATALDRSTGLVQRDNANQQQKSLRVALYGLIDNSDSGDLPSLSEMSSLLLNSNRGNFSSLYRTLISQYEGNDSIFALDLRGAVLRQCSFVKKMHQLDWLHSPVIFSTIARSIEKYEQFLTIIQQSPFEPVVPSLDIDLVWHTHQLSPQHYYKICSEKTGRFVDHDDNVDKVKLDSSMDQTKQKYAKLYGKTYSHCVCWDCEIARLIDTKTLLPLSIPADKTLNVVQLNKDNAAPIVSQWRAARSVQLAKAYFKAWQRAQLKGSSWYHGQDGFSNQTDCEWLETCLGNDGSGGELFLKRMGMVLRHGDGSLGGGPEECSSECQNPPAPQPESCWSKA